MLRRTQICTLAEPLRNPKPDGRKTDWTGCKTFEAGRYALDDVSIRRVKGGRWSTVLRSAFGREQYDALAPALVPVEPIGIRELLLALGSEDNAASILGLLLKQGTVSAKTIEAAAIILDEADEEFWETL